MGEKRPTRRPPIHLIDSEADSLMGLALAVEERQPQVAALLIREIERAKIHSEARIPANVVTMQTTVRFIDEASGKDSTFRLVYPKEADISAGRISILTPVGAGLIGLRVGQSILWPDRDGHERTLKIVEVVQAPRSRGAGMAPRAKENP